MKWLLFAVGITIAAVWGGDALMKYLIFCIIAAVIYGVLKGVHLATCVSKKKD